MTSKRKPQAPKRRAKRPGEQQPSAQAGAAAGEPTQQEGPAEPATEPTPYGHDLEYLEDELAWVRHRGLRMKASLALERIKADPSPKLSAAFRGPSEESPATIQRTYERALAAERHMRAHIDRRLEVHRRGHPELSLDRLCRTFDLDAFERTTLILAAAPCLSLEFDGVFEAIVPHRMGSGLTVEAVSIMRSKPLCGVARGSPLSERGSARPTPHNLRFTSSAASP